MRFVGLTLAVGLVLPGLAACASGSSGDAGGSASCAAVLDYAGHRYSGYGDLVRRAPVTGRTETGVLPGCDDGNGPAVAEQVEVRELVDLPLSRALLVGDQFFYREDFPELARSWFIAPTCETTGPFTVSGTWLDVTGEPKPRFDGDLRLPYRLRIEIAEGPQEYVGATVQVRATRGTAPALGPVDLERALWQSGGVLTAALHCSSGRFVADGLSTTGRVRHNGSP